MDGMGTGSSARPEGSGLGSVMVGRGDPEAAGEGVEGLPPDEQAPATSATAMAISVPRAKRVMGLR